MIFSFKHIGNKLLSDKYQVQIAIVVASQALYLFTGFYPRETQLLALWLFLNPELNIKKEGCLSQISTGEGKSIIVACLAAIRALGCHRVDIVTSSSVLAIRDAEKFKEFYEMFNLQVSNNCDALCEQGDGSQTAEIVRKQRYNNHKGPIDIIYGDCSCFQRDLLETEFNKNDPSQNIIGTRLESAETSVIIDEVDSMLLDKANMVLYLTHNLETLKSLERIFVSIWEIANQQHFENLSNQISQDDLVDMISDVVYKNIESNNINVANYETKNCDYMNMRLFVKRRVPVWVRSAFHVKKMIPNDSYIISRDKFDKSSDAEIKITIMDKVCFLILDNMG